MTPASNQRAICVMGPTGVGKTALALDLARRLPVAIISVDSAMVYRGMNVGTAKPNSQVLTEIPHRLVDICDPTEVYSAARFRTDCLQEMEHAFRQGLIPLLVGGTGLYFRALEDGLSLLPEPDQGLRKRLAEEATVYGWAGLHARLAQIDPGAADRIHPNDPQRIQRALEVYELSGKTLSQWCTEPSRRSCPYSLTKIVLAPEDRGNLYARLKLRFLRMLKEGLLDEVWALRERGALQKSHPAARLVGYREVLAFFDRALDYDSMKEQAILSTRRLAKRQITWFRAETEPLWIAAQGPAVLAQVLSYVNKSSTLLV
ncbi:MAG: tRNA (adenosine(37)-N6)-dimethylallyltransferase MiaA [Gammaproteobacteria bacterium]